jgi:NAD(P)-dependent dehydrogenase (short-subunit alcohol dehydrogenase family)
VIVAPPARRTAVVTGGGRGIGAAIARALAASGARVVVAARSVDEIEAVAGELRAAGAEAWGLPCDVSDEPSVRELGRAVREQAGPADILVNNAGLSSSAPIAKLTLAEWNRVLGVVATGTFLCTREFLPPMVERGWGRVVNVASVAGLDGAKYIAHYSAAKHAVIGFTRSVALEVAGTGVTVNAVCPAYVDTPMTERTLANVQARTGLGRADALRAVLASVGQHRLVQPEEVATAVVAFCRDASGEHNGQVIAIDEGRGAA